MRFLLSLSVLLLGSQAALACVLKGQAEIPEGVQIKDLEVRATVWANSKVNDDGSFCFSPIKPFPVILPVEVRLLQVTEGKAKTLYRALSFNNRDTLELNHISTAKTMYCELQPCAEKTYFNLGELKATQELADKIKLNVVNKTAEGLFRTTYEKLHDVIRKMKKRYSEELPDYLIEKEHKKLHLQEVAKNWRLGKEETYLAFLNDHRIVPVLKKQQDDKDALVYFFRLLNERAYSLSQLGPLFTPEFKEELSIRLRKQDTAWIKALEDTFNLYAKAERIRGGDREAYYYLKDVLPSLARLSQDRIYFNGSDIGLEFKLLNGAWRLHNLKILKPELAQIPAKQAHGLMVYP